MLAAFPSSENESEKVEECAIRLTHAFSLAPHVYPVRSYMPFFRAYLPEVTCVIPDNTQTLVCISERDAAAPTCRRVARSILGATFDRVFGHGVRLRRTVLSGNRRSKLAKA